MKRHFSKLALAVASATAITLSGCGGGGSSGNPDGGAPPPAAATFTGTAAAGLPLIGTVTVKDAAGTTRTVNIGDNGAYTINVAGMTAPFVFRAEGTAGGSTYVLHSGATTADVNGTINVTPLTDLVIANVAGQLAASYFESGNFATLTQDEINAEKNALRDKLLPVLEAMGVEDSIDLLRTPFTPLASALDKALDVIRVSFDPDSQVATLTNVVNGLKITDDLSTKAAEETEADKAPLSDSGTTPSASDDVQAVTSAIQAFAKLFETGLPSAATIESRLFAGAGSGNTADASLMPFRYNDKNATQWATALASDGAMLGVTFANITIHKMDAVSAAIPFPRAHVGFTLKDKDGRAIGHIKSVQVAKGSDGVWRLRGDGRRLDIGGWTHMTKQHYNGQAACYSTGIEFEIFDFNPGNNGGIISYVMVTGPGLPNGGLRYEPTDGGDWHIANVANQNGKWFVMASDCHGGSASAGMSDAAIAAIPSQAQYNITAFRPDDTVAQAGGFSVSYNEVIPQRPLTLTETRAASFPVITSPTLGDFASFDGGDLTISGSNTNPNMYVWIYSSIASNTEENEVDRDIAPSSNGAFSQTFNLGSLTNPVIRREIRVESFDNNIFRPLMTSYLLEAN